MWCPKQNVCVFFSGRSVVILGFPSFWNGVNSSGFFCRFACIRHWGVLHVLSATGHCVGTPRSRWSKSANDSPALSSLTTSPMRAADMNQVEPPIYVAELSLTCVFSARSSWQRRIHLHQTGPSVQRNAFWPTWTNKHLFDLALPRKNHENDINRMSRIGSWHVFFDWPSDNWW